MNDTTKAFTSMIAHEFSISRRAADQMIAIGFAGRSEDPPMPGDWLLIPPTRHLGVLSAEMMSRETFGGSIAILGRALWSGQNVTAVPPGVAQRDYGTFTIPGILRRFTAE